jgi:phosphate:Na+ symporter
MVIGTNIGTTVTALLGAIGGIPDKKRAAFAHLIFNVLTAFAAFLILPFLSSFLMKRLALESDPTTALALFHTIFNFMGVLLLAPFIPLMAKYLKKMFVHVRPMPTKYIHLVDTEVPDTALVALRNEVSNLFVKTMKFALLLANIRPNDIFSKNSDAKTTVAQNQGRIDFDHHKTYKNIKEIEVYTVAFVNRLNEQNLTPEQSQSLDTLLVSVRESVYAAKLLKDIKDDINEFSESDNLSILKVYDEIRSNLAYAMIIFVNYMEEKWPLDKCFQKFANAEEKNVHIMRETMSLVSKEHVNEIRVVSLLNTNRSVYMALQSLMAASKVVNLHFPLEEEGL